MNPAFGGPFHGPGRFGSPGEARAAQIARQQAAAQDGAEIQKDHKGSILDGLSGLVHGASLGIVDLGGDKNSARYRGGDLASYIPISPGGVVRDAAKIAEKIGIKETRKAAAHEVGETVAREAGGRVRRSEKYWNMKTDFEGRRVYQRDDLIDPNAVDHIGRTNVERMHDGNPPLGPDGKEIVLHHLTQTNDGSLAEIAASMHTKNHKVLHINPKSIPSGIDRAEFDALRARYWRRRALDYEN
jgi:hypothetical protein